MEYETRGSPENPNTPLGNWAAVDAAIEINGGYNNQSGFRVTDRKALALPVLYRGIRLIGETVGSLPFITYRRLERGKERATDHPVYRLLRTSPNEVHTAVVFYETLIADAMLNGNAYAYIERGPDFRPTQLIRLDPKKTESGIINGQPYFATKVGDEVRYLDSYEVLHIPSLYGEGIVSLFAQAIGLAKAAETFGAMFFGGNAVPSGVLEHPTALDPKQRANLRDGWERKHTGLNNAQKVAILEGGTKFTKISFSPEESQMLGTRQFQVSEIARIIGVAENKLGGNQPNLYSNREANELAFLQDSIQPWLTRIEQEVNRKLFANDEQDAYFAEFLIDNRLRADSAARGAFYKTLFDMGAIVPNEVRESENRNPYEDTGEEPVVNGAYVKLADIGKVPAEAPAPAPSADEQPVEEKAAPVLDTAARTRLTKRYATLMADAFTRAATAEPEALAGIVAPVLAAYADAVGELAARDVGAAEPPATDSDFLSKYAANLGVRYQRAKATATLVVPELAGREATRARHAFTRRSYELLGVSHVRWVGGTHDGKVVGIKDTFDGTARKLSHPDATNVGELHPHKGE